MLYMFLAEGFEETEAIGCLDVIRRAGIDIKTVSIEGSVVTGSHGVKVFADIDKTQLKYEKMQGIILPGGLPGTTNLEKDEDVQKAIKLCADKGLMLGAICAAPMVFGKCGILKGKRAVCYPGFEQHLQGANVVDSFVSVDKNIITAKGAGASMMFGAAIVDYFKAGEGQSILKQMQHKLI